MNYKVFIIIFFFFISCKNSGQKKYEVNPKPKGNITFPDYGYKISRKDFNTEIDSIKSEIEKEPYMSLIKTWDGKQDNRLQEYSHHLKKSKIDFFKVMLSINGGIDSIYYNARKKKVLLFVSGDDVDGKKDFNNMQKSVHFDGDYYKYHDIYYSMFSFKDINFVSIFDTDLKEFVTRLPSAWDDTITIECNEMNKKWYIKNLNYHKIIDSHIISCDSLNTLMKKYTAN